MLLVKVVILLVLYEVHVNGECIKGLTLPIGRKCQLYLKCEEGLLKLTKCNAGYFYDSSVKSCSLGEADKSCDIDKYNDSLNHRSKTNNINVHKSGIPTNAQIKTLQKRESIKEWSRNHQTKTTEDNYWTGTDGTGATGTKWPWPADGISTKGDFWTGTDGTAASGTEFPLQKDTTEGNYWTGTDGTGATGTGWPNQKFTTRGNYWTGTDGTGATGTEWPERRMTTQGNYWTGTDGTDATGTKWPADLMSTEGNFWTGTDGTGLTGTKWPFQPSTTEGNYWTGTDGTGATGTGWPDQKVTTEGNYWTGTDGTGATGTDWPSFVSTHNSPSSKHHSPVTVTFWPTESSSAGKNTDIPFTSETPADKTVTNNDFTATEAPATHWTFTERSVTPSKGSSGTKSTVTKSPESSATGTEWTVTANSMSTGSLWTVKVNHNITTHSTFG